MLEAEKYVAFCFGFHCTKCDKATCAVQYTDKRYINARTQLRQSVYLPEIHIKRKYNGNSDN